MLGLWDGLVVCVLGLCDGLVVCVLGLCDGLVACVLGLEGLGVEGLGRNDVCGGLVGRDVNSADVGDVVVLLTGVEPVGVGLRVGLGEVVDVGLLDVTGRLVVVVIVVVVEVVFLPA